jgi:hypothetical protein
VARSALWLVSAVVATLAVSGCTPGTQPSAAPTAPPSSSAPARSPDSPTRTACENTVLTLSIAPSNPTAGETVEITTAPEQCLVTEEWAGDIIVRNVNAPVDTDPDTETGSRIDTGTPQPLTVTIPAGLEGDVYIMLEPDLDCEDWGDCYYPFAAATIEAPGG